MKQVEKLHGMLLILKDYLKMIELELNRKLILLRN